MKTLHYVSLCYNVKRRLVLPAKCTERNQTEAIKLKMKNGLKLKR